MYHAWMHPIYKNSNTPVILCRNKVGYPVLYANPSAVLLFYHGIKSESTEIEQANLLLAELFGNESRQALQVMVQTILTEGWVSGFLTNVIRGDGDPVVVSISGNLIEEEDAFILYIHEKQGETIVDEDTAGAVSANAVISVVLRESFQWINVDEAINKILQIIGQYLNVSRSYIFEDLFDEYTRNTYEWCNEGVEPCIQHLQHLRKIDYNYHEIVKVGKLIYDDISTMPDGQGREILEEQSIKAIAILTLYRGGQAIGYVGFDDCNQSRKWTGYEMQVLEQVANLLTSLIEQRRVWEQEKQSLEVLKTISDHMNQIVYASDMQNHEVVFANRYLADLHGKEPDDLLGKKCWEILQLKESKCDGCPLDKMIDESGTIVRRDFVWDFENPLNFRWYRARDSIIKWFDSRDVHLQVAMDVTEQKSYEKTLEHYASTDSMTGLLNREWGSREIRRQLRQREEEPMCLCFLDVDDLKKTNDTYGHDAGDALLVRIVEILKDSTRSSDVICRWGGDEFVVLLRCNEQQAKQLMCRVVDKLDQINATKTLPYALAISYGLVPIHQFSQANLDQLITMADNDMYLHKGNKRETSALL